MKRFLYILITLLVFTCIGTFTVNADTGITKLDTNSGKYYAEFDKPLDWIVIKQSTGALVWINDTTKHSLAEVKELAMSVNPSLANSVRYWGMISGYGTFSNNVGNTALPNGFQGNPWGVYSFIKQTKGVVFYVNICGVSNVTYSYTDEVIITPPDEPDTPDEPVIPDTPIIPDKPDTPVVPVTPVTPDYSPKTGDVDSQTMVLLAIMLMGAVAMWFVTYRR